MKVLKIIFINLLFFLILFFLLDIFTYYRQLYISYKHNPIEDNISYFKHITRDLSEKNVNKIIYENINYPKAENTTSELNPIVIFGCSFAQGAGLSENQTFSHKLALISKAPVYNRASGGWGTQHMLFQLKSDDLYKNVLKDNRTPLFIYIYIPDHINRIHRAMEPVLYGGYPTFVYKFKQNQLIFDKTSQFLFRFPLLSYIKEYLYTFKTVEEKADFLFLHLLEAKKEINKHYKNADFIVLVYSDNDEILSVSRKLTKNGIKVVFFEGLTNINPENEDYYISKYDNHPNERAWDLLTPKFYNYIKNANYNEVTKQANFKQDYIKIHYSPKTRDYTLAKSFPSSYSLYSLDKKLIEQEKINKFRAVGAYVSWCISNLFYNNTCNFISGIFLDISIKMNPYNENYKIYKKILKTN